MADAADSVAGRALLYSALFIDPLLFWRAEWLWFPRLGSCALSLTESLAPQPWRHYITRFDRLWRHEWPARAVDPEKVKSGEKGERTGRHGETAFVQQLYIQHTPAFRLALRAQYYRGLRTCPAVGDISVGWHAVS